MYLNNFVKILLGR